MGTKRTKTLNRNNRQQNITNKTKNMTITLNELKDQLNTKYGFDIGRRSRKRNISYAKKVFCVIARKLNYGWQEIGDTIGIAHEVAYYHSRSFIVVNAIDRRFHDEVVYENNLLIELKEVKKVEEVPEVAQESVRFVSDEVKLIVSQINDTLFNWDVNTLNDFIDNRLKPYDRLASVKVSPKEVTSIIGASISGRVSNPFLK